MPLYATDTFYTDDCPYGTASDYTKFVASDAETNISFGTAFVNITLAAFTSCRESYFRIRRNFCASDSYQFSEL